MLSSSEREGEGGKKTSAPAAKQLPQTKRASSGCEITARRSRTGEELPERRSTAVRSASLHAPSLRAHEQLAHGAGGEGGFSVVPAQTEEAPPSCNSALRTSCPVPRAHRTLRGSQRTRQSLIQTFLMCRTAARGSLCASQVNNGAHPGQTLCPRRKAEAPPTRATVSIQGAPAVFRTAPPARHAASTILSIITILSNVSLSFIIEVDAPTVTHSDAGS
ncbi:hypothetical protein AOLI_G00077110 [Acnodon oligacanthus]